jgi:hypothetical protein
VAERVVAERLCNNRRLSSLPTMSRKMMAPSRCMMMSHNPRVIMARQHPWAAVQGEVSKNLEADFARWHRKVPRLRDDSRDRAGLCQEAGARFRREGVRYYRGRARAASSRRPRVTTRPTCSPPPGPRLSLPRRELRFSTPPECCSTPGPIPTTSSSCVQNEVPL